MIEQTFRLGQPVRARGVFRNSDGDLVDPDPVVIRSLQPDGTETSYTYGVDSVVRDDEGIYAVWIPTTGGTDGDWTARFEGGSGDDMIVDESVFYVAPSRFAEA